MSNHPDHITHTSQIFFKLSPVVGIIKFELVTPSSFQNRISHVAKGHKIATFENYAFCA